MQILDGKKVSQEIKDNLRKKINESNQLQKRAPHLAAILIGNNGASETYVASKIRNCEEVGFKSSLVRFENEVSESALVNAIEKLNTDDGVDGILV